MASSSGVVRGQAGPSSPGAGARDGNGSGPDAPGPGASFPRSRRLTSRRQYRLVYRLGRKTATPSLVLFGTRNDLGRCRLGITVTRKVGGAVTRNRLKRVLREIFRRRDEGGASLDLVVNVLPSMRDRSFDEIRRDFVGAVDTLNKRLAR